ncbi:hypothetical protein H7J51_06935 [Mycobacterium crocinum]|uniref:Uncharacterized protein n=1 Tax=Mycolicibacterium crocinum TaxID=388459 RepID=A0ABY3TSH4_9MYCO|nr:hypothetical protein [Mycolicibacterium crocinum]MCV7215016.1 hypothetical protein [Mycolicibacterium crocinum]ULN42080.1 hypothetical protein MI149_02830 [Mycolicibacterium crocinum]
MTLDPQRRHQLLKKFPALSNVRPMDPRANTQVRAIERAQQIMSKTWLNLAMGDGVFFDPARVPPLARRADADAAEFHRRAAKGRLRYNTWDTDYDPDDPAEQGVVRIWAVGTDHVDIVRDRWHDAPTRRLSTVSFSAGSLAHKVDTLDYWDCRRYGCEGNCGLECNIQLTPACDTTARLLATDRGTLILLYRCCWSCEEVAGKIAAETYKTNVQIAHLEAVEVWPPGSL